MSMYKTCPLCGANLDPGEKCDCNKKAAVSAANADNGKAGNGIPSQIPASHDNRNTWRNQDMKANECSDMKNFYIVNIVKMMKKCNDVSLLNLIYKILCKSM